MGAITYLLQVSGCMAIFYLFYYLLLRRLTFFIINRYYLLVTLVLSFIIPALTIPVHEYVPYTAQVNVPQNLPTHTFVTHTLITATTTKAINWLLLLKATYLVVAIGLFVRLIIMLVGFFARIRNKKVKRVGHINIIQGNKQLTNGSFLNYIFLNDAELNPVEIQQIIAHEMLHVKLMHSVDRILVKMAQIILWFNLFAYLYERSIEENHEFEVDREIARSTNKTEYADLLLHLSVAAKGMIYNSFSKAPLKKRIIMLFNQPSASIKRLVYILVIPILLLSCMAFAKFKQDNKGQSIIDQLKKPIEKLVTNAKIYTQGVNEGANNPNEIKLSAKAASAVATDTNKKLKIALGIVTKKDTIPANEDMSKMSPEQLKKLISSAKFEDGKFYSRAVLDGGYYDMIRVCMSDKITRGEVTVRHNAKVIFIIGDKLYEETEVAGFTQVQIDALAGKSFGLGGDTKYFKDQFPGFDFSKYETYVGIGIDFNKLGINKVVLGNDTSTLNKALLNAKPNSVIGTLLKLLPPGTKINADGTVSHGDKPITQFNINGKHYTSSDIQAEIKNLLANGGQDPPDEKPHNNK